ncbi:MAG: NAD(P)/FAD-dependent oxidoreductase [Bacteroidetes bacterium]|nr:NAD(P)/FAD-dependent oxidoreductase [Bacteroidota bacterium]
MTPDMIYDVIIVGGSYSGLAAAMALGRASRRVLVIDSKKPCNRQTPHSHNFLTHDGAPPAQIAAIAREQVEQYSTVEFVTGVAIAGAITPHGVRIGIASGRSFDAKKLIFATGIVDEMPDIPGFAECWGISVLHCPYCHGYEVRNENTGILANGDAAFEFATLLSQWTNELTVFTNGASTLSPERSATLERHGIRIDESEIDSLQHIDGHLQTMIFKNGTATTLKALYSRRPFRQHCTIAETLGCELTDQGYLKIDATQQTTIRGIYASGDNTTPMRTVANAVATGTAAGMHVNKELIHEAF